jgi:hypothetical protein
MENIFNEIITYDKTKLQLIIMNNTFEKQPITEHYFNKSFKTNLECDLFNYICNNLHDENHLLKLDLEGALTTNANGKYN